MQMEIDVSMDYAVAPGAVALLTIDAALTDGQQVLDDNLQTDATELNRVTGDAGIGQRVWLQPSGDRLSLRYRARVAVTRPVEDLTALAVAPAWRVPAEAAAFLRPSRYANRTCSPPSPGAGSGISTAAQRLPPSATGWRPR